MGKFRRNPTFLFVLWFILLSIQILTGDGDHGGEFRVQNNEEETSLANILTETISTLRNSHKNSWDKLKSIIHQLQLKFSPPDLDFRGAKEDGNWAGEKMKEAAIKSSGLSKVTIEKSAETAAEALHKTAEKVKAGVSGNHKVDDEL